MLVMAESAYAIHEDLTVKNLEKQNSIAFWLENFHSMCNFCMRQKLNLNIAFSPY